MSEVRVTFKKPAKLGQDAALALEDYARATSSCDAVVVIDSAHHVIGVQLAAGGNQVPEALLQDIERFFDSLVADSADRLGWS
ncbi:MAG: hypothetical protein JJE39_09490 [Vicinamibacteria bacterium]|nr:hypothetical protein [Vicinamibacteria bacterium]